MGIQNLTGRVQSPISFNSFPSKALFFVLQFRLFAAPACLTETRTTREHAGDVGRLRGVKEKQCWQSKGRMVPLTRRFVCFSSNPRIRGV